MTVTDFASTCPTGAARTGDRHYSQEMGVWLREDVWLSVGDELRAYRHQGLSHVLTEDSVRFTTARALVTGGEDPGGLRVEWPHPALAGARIDLVAGGRPPAALIEFKFPREPNEQNAAWTMALGEVLKDLYRLAAYPDVADRLFVYVESTRLRTYMAGAARRYGLDLDTDEVALRPADAARLPTTAAKIIGADLAAHHVIARRIALVDIDPGLRLAVYLVDPLGAQPDPLAGGLVTDRAVPEIRQADSVPRHADPAAANVDAVARTRALERDGARREILEAIRAVTVRSGRATFTPLEIVAEMGRCGTRYAESTIRTRLPEPPSGATGATSAPADRSR